VTWPRLDASDPSVRAHHLLALPDDVAEDEVEVLAQSRFAGARWVDAPEPAPTTRSIMRPVTAVLNLRSVAEAAPSRSLRIGRRSSLRGPYRVEPADAVALNLPPGTTLAYVVEAPRERGSKPYPGGDRDGLKRAFPEGMPIQEEERVLVWLVAAARRLGGAVRTAEHGVVLVPDIDSAIDLVVYSDRWLEPSEALAVVRRVQPTAFLPQVHARAWAGPMPGAGRAHGDVPLGLPEAGGRGLAAALDRFGVADDAERARLAAEAAAFDAHMLTHPPLPHGYGLLVDLGVDGILAVEVSAADDDLPPLLAGLPWTASGVVGYRVRWEPLLIEELEVERPSFEHRVARGRAAPQLQAIARSLHAAIGIEIADEAGFLVDPADL
jgi:hypothetical protein